MKNGDLMGFDEFFEDLLATCANDIQRDALYAIQKELLYAYQQSYDDATEQAKKYRDRIMKMREL